MKHPNGNLDWIDSAVVEPSGKVTLRVSVVATGWLLSPLPTKIKLSLS